MLGRPLLLYIYLHGGIDQSTYKTRVGKEEMRRRDRRIPLMYYDKILKPLNHKRETIKKENVRFLKTYVCTHIFGGRSRAITKYLCIICFFNTYKNCTMYFMLCIVCIVCIPGITHYFIK